MRHLVIMAGGVGSRFWPMSTLQHPKQFIDVLGVGKSLLQLTVERFHGICPEENVWVVTSAIYRELVRKQLPHVPDDHILLEPCMRNTAPCIAYATWKIKKKDPEATLVISPADHLVLNTGEFVRVVSKGLDFVRDSDRILTLGMKPDRPATGFGYIRVKEGGILKEEEICQVDSFKEKPDLATARAYLETGGYYWNAGIFLWNVKTVEKAFRTYSPAIAEIFDNLDASFYTSEEQQQVDRLFPDCEAISIDYAVMEHAHNIYVFPADFGWSDLGTWGSLYDLLDKDCMWNAIVGGTVRMVDSEGCIVRMPAGKKVVLQGLKDYIVAEENGILLVCRKEDEQRIKEFGGML